MFPFNHIKNDDEFVNTIYCYGHLPINSIILASLNEIVYNPFVYDRKRAIINNKDIDPDCNYFNTQVVHDCTYLLADEFNEIIDKHWKPSAQLGRLILAHAYELSKSSMQL